MKFLVLLTLFISFGTRAQDVLVSEFKGMIAQSKVGTLKEQAFCYLKDNMVSGYQPDKLQRIASVTKLLSTFLISETTNLHTRFTTRIYLTKDSIHIEGGRDPYFEEDKLLLLFLALNDLGVKSLKQVSFNKDFLFNDIALGSYERITPEKSRIRLAAYLNPKNITLRKTRWQSIRKFAAEEGIVLPSTVPVVTTGKVFVSDTNPLSNLNPSLYIHTSRPLHSLLKTMNVQSKNYVAENIYSAGSAIKSLAELFSQYGINQNTYRIYNGSGLPVLNKNSRLDNLATCSTVLKVIELLSDSLKKHHLQLSDVVAVNGGKDLGSFRNRFEEFPETHESVLSKTGTLKHTSSLAGVLLNGVEMPFAILNHSTNSSVSRSFQDRFVAKMFDFLGPPIPLDYLKISIFPWDGSDFLVPAY